jgi:hypothetical protein
MSRRLAKFSAAINHTKRFGVKRFGTIWRVLPLAKKEPVIFSISQSLS